jgi:hypothetical protein
MATEPNAEFLAAALTVPERLLLFCLASDTDVAKACVTHATAQNMMVRGLIEQRLLQSVPRPTIFMIAHRLESRRHYQRVLVFEVR